MVSRLAPYFTFALFGLQQVVACSTGRKDATNCALLKGRTGRLLLLQKAIAMTFALFSLELKSGHIRQKQREVEMDSKGASPAAPTSPADGDASRKEQPEDLQSVERAESTGSMDGGLGGLSTRENEEVPATDANTVLAKRTPFTSLSQVDADMVLAQTLQDQVGMPFFLLNSLCSSWFDQHIALSSWFFLLNIIVLILKL